MKKWILAPDTFKETIKATEICNILEKSIHKFFPMDEVVSVPMADGGEGITECIINSLGGDRIQVEIHDPYGDNIEAEYVRLGKSVYIEMASAAGLPLMTKGLNPLSATTYGVGEMIKHAVDHGAKKIMIGLGGSATNDCGCGCAAALGTRFLDSNGDEILPVGGTLKKVQTIDVSESNKLLSGVSITGLCDVDNLMFGREGAAYVYSPQKGANADDVILLDDNLKAINSAIKENLHLDVSDVPGAGAAGAMGAGVIAFLNGKLQSGVNAILDITSFEEKMKSAYVVITGEGRVDKQSLSGKVVCGVVKCAKKYKVPVIIIAGEIEKGAEKFYEMGCTAMFSINRKAEEFSKSRFAARRNLENTFEDIVRLIWRLS